MQKISRFLGTVLVIIFSSNCAESQEYASFESVFKTAAFAKCLSFTRDNISLATWEQEKTFIKIDGNKFARPGMPVLNAWKTNFDSGHLIIIAHGNNTQACSTYVYSDKKLPVVELTDKYLSGGALPEFLLFQQVETSVRNGLQTKNYRQISDKKIHASLTTISNETNSKPQLTAIITFSY